MNINKNGRKATFCDFSFVFSNASSLFKTNRDKLIVYKKFINNTENAYTKTPLPQLNPNSKSGYHGDGAWNQDTACPSVKRTRLEKNLVFRWPDAVGIGFPKCGTGTLNFIDCHSRLVYRSAEPNFWINQGQFISNREETLTHCV